MAKMNIIKPTGSESFNLLSAFKEDGNTYLIFDSERMGSMGLPIIYISKYTDKLEKINDDNEWQSVKNYLKGIINGTNFHYVKMGDNINADEAYYTPLTLPQASFDMIKSRYVVEDEANASEEVLTPNTSVAPEVTSIPVIEPKADTPVISEPTIPVVEPVKPEVGPTPPVGPVAPVIPNVDAVSNMASTLEQPTVVPAVNTEPVVPPVASISETPNNDLENAFMKDKETFLKACENMFDALVSKYEKKLRDVEAREKAILNKEQEIDYKLKNANEHLANAEAREQVANIAHDNAQKVMDLSNFMPSNPNGN